MLKSVRKFASKQKFYWGFNPKILPADKSFIPKNYESVLLISADFELAWAVCHSRKHEANKNLQQATIDNERKNIPKILNICDSYNIPITWATVGHLFLDQCSYINGKKHPEVPLIKAYNGLFWDFDGVDWFAPDPCSNIEANPEWYAPDLINKILASSVQHEIACHSFSHIDCRDGICSPNLLKAELTECKKLASQINLTLKSFVHPGHTIGNIDVLQEEGFTNFRTDYRNVLGYPRKHSSGIWELEQTAELVFNKDWTVDYHLFRYKKIIDRAIRSNTVCVLWFHPSCNPDLVDIVFPEVFRYFSLQRDKILITTHANYIEWLSPKNNI